MLKKTKGSTYIFVLVISAAVFIMLSMIVKMTKFEVDVSNAYIDNANLYYLSESGIHKGLGAVNEILSSAVFEDMDTMEQKILTASEFLQDYIGANIPDYYFELLRYEIETLNKDNMNITYYITVYIKINYTESAYTIMSVAENAETSVNILGYIDLITEPDDIITTQLKLLKQVDE